MPGVRKGGMRGGAAAAAAVLLALAAGCGGSGSSEGTTTTTAAQAPAQTQSARLSPASWAAYVQKRAKAQAVNNTAIKTFATCRHLIYSSVPAERIQACLGNSTSVVVRTGKSALATLNSLSDQTEGACAASVTQFAGHVKLYIASVQALGVAVSGDQPASEQSAIDNSLEALKGTKASRLAFERACRPVA
jgi:hypothetical protein